MIGKGIVFFLIWSYLVDASLLPILLNNLSDIGSWNHLYRTLLHDTQQHSLTDTVSLPINLTIIQSNQYTEDYLKHAVNID